jgi:hypothetical protein
MLLPLRFSRANTIPETALVISLVMVTLFGVIEYAMAGFNQLGADGAAFVGDHATVAEYSGNPTITQGNVYGASVGKTNFPQASGYSASVPKSGTFEMDLSATHSVPGGLTLFPSVVSARSRIVEPAQTTAISTTPQGQCAKFVSKITVGSQTILSTPLALLSSFPSTGVGTATQNLYEPVTDTSGNVALSFANGLATETTQLNALNALSTNFSNTASGLATISSVLAPFGSLGTTIAQGISAQVSPLLNSAAGGTYTATAGGTISVTTPLTSAQFNAQVTASTNAIGTLEGSNLLSGLLSSTLSTVVNPLLYGTSTTPGILTGGPNGGFLTQMNNAENTLYSLNLKVPSC